MWATIIVLILSLTVIILINNYENKHFENKKIDKQKKIIYKIKPIMTQYEKDFYFKIKDLEKEYSIVPQLNLASVIKKYSNQKFCNELFRNVDFAIFSKDYEQLLLLIELNDKTHNKPKRRDRDLKVQKICNDINIKLIKFYTKYPNEKEYITTRIKKEIENEN